MTVPALEEGGAFWTNPEEMLERLGGADR
jgi:hypothetical protein